MKKKLLALLIIACSLVVPVASAGASSHDQLFGDACDNTPDAAVCKDAEKDQSNNADNSITGPNGALNNIANVLLIIVGAATVIMIIVGGFRMIFGVGDPAKIAEGRNTILYAVIGLVVAFMANAIIRFVINRL